MTLLVVSTWCPYPTVNGSTLRAYHLLRALASAHVVDLVTFAAPTRRTAKRSPTSGRSAATSP